ncbi:glucan biosynthesis protein [Hansschlegelia beijingensis]|uniref:Glucans biosynthesis protein n=1 Tax=Hansschlegelia beijingensis TaxID=1133344 RepID=A0A7W6D5P0_9HYPH|nr:glucan biosynthesis protein D [Hansschlegelia beijingensis]MBB3974715.1 glucans biosynthesis protein [Hansschlegelia beijingensis]
MSRSRLPDLQSAHLLDRRTVLQIALAAQAALAFGGPARAAGTDRLKFGKPEPFSYDGLKAFARNLAGKPYQPPAAPDPAIVQKIDYDAHGKIKFKPEDALYAESAGAYPITFMHVGRFFPKTVRMHAVADGQSREILYDPSLFDMPADSIARGLPPQPSAFAGFWVREAKDQVTDKGDWKAREPFATFLGASYFRAIGAAGQVGMSARGVALFPAPGAAEEFPDFISFWFEPARTNGEPVTVFALLDGPSLSGAYRFLIHRTAGTLMEIEAEVTMRKEVARLGLAPLTSMYWFSETAKPNLIDWRPEVHDSDGLAMWTGAGERIWRPLNNPPRIMTSTFSDENPKGFGLLQRDRDFDHYEDGVRYEDRPSTWVEPVGDWGKGAVQLVELPTDDEIHDNVVAYWIPEQSAAPGATIALAYKLHWQDDEPFPTGLGRCVATRLGRGGQPGLPRPAGVRKFIVEFLGGPLADIPYGETVEPVLWASRGKFSYVFAEAVPSDIKGHWRAQFDLTVEGPEPVEMRCYLKAGGQVLTETWLYQYHPAP